MKRLSSSFSKEEVEIFCQVSQKLLAGSDVRGLMKNQNFSSLIRKFLSMRDKVDLPNRIYPVSDREVEIL